MLRFSLLFVALATLTATGCRSTTSYRAAYPAPGCCPTTARAAVVVPAPAPCAPGAPFANGQIPPPPPPRF